MNISFTPVMPASPGFAACEVIFVCCGEAPKHQGHLQAEVADDGRVLMHDGDEARPY